MMYASWLTDRREYTKALELYEEIYSHRYEVIPLYVREMACEMIFLYLVTGQKERAIALYDKDLEDYISKYRRVMSAKERILCAIALYIENDRAKAEEIYEQLLARRPDFLIQGEVESDLALMRDMLEDSAC